MLRVVYFPPEIAQTRIIRQIVVWERGKIGESSRLAEQDQNSPTKRYR